MQNNLGTNFEIYIVSSAKQESKWLYKYELAVDKGADASPVKASVRCVRRGGTQSDLADLVSKITTDIKAYKGDLEGEDAREVEVIFHFLAHGLASRGVGEGLVGLANKETLSWRELSQIVVQPIAEASDELIMVIESCFGGSLLNHLPQGFFVNNNAMLIFGAPSWASQFAPTGERKDDDIDKSTELRKLFTSSVASMAIKLALTGYASEGFVKGGTTEHTLNKNAPAPEEAVLFDKKEVKIFKKVTLKEKHVVRVNEFVKYIEGKGKLINCINYRELRSDVVKNICEDKKLKDYGAGIYDSKSSAAVDLPFIARMAKEEFKKFAENNYILPPVIVKYPTAEDAGLNPNGIIPQGNRILSVVNLQIFEDAQANDPNYQKFIAIDKQGFGGIEDEFKICVKALDQINDDLWSVTQWRFRETPQGAGTPVLPQTLPKNEDIEVEPTAKKTKLNNADFADLLTKLVPSSGTGKPKFCDAYSHISE